MEERKPTQDGAVLSLHLEMHLVSTSVILGEPIILRYRLSSTSEQEIAVHMGRDKQDWFTMSLENSSKTPMPPRSDPRLRQGGIYSTEARVSARNPASGYIVVSQRLLVSQTGDYDLLLNVSAPYEVYSSGRNAAHKLGGQTAEKTVLTESHAFSLTVAKAQPSRLRAIAEALCEAAVQAGTVERMMSLEALFSMPEEHALDSWQAAASDPRLLYSRSFVADQLERLSTIAAADILAEMVSSTPPNIVGKPQANGKTEVDGPSLTFSFSVHRQFYNMYFHADPELKAYLVKMYTDHGLALPDRPILTID